MCIRDRYDSMSGAVSRGDTYLSETHCKLRRSAAVGKRTSSHSLGSAKRDLCIVLNIIVDMSVPLRGDVYKRQVLTTRQEFHFFSIFRMILQILEEFGKGGKCIIRDIAA